MSIKIFEGWKQLQQPYGGGGGGSGPQVAFDRGNGIGGGNNGGILGDDDDAVAAIIKLLTSLMSMPGQGKKQQEFITTQRVDSGDSIELFSASSAKGQASMQTAKEVGFANVGNASLGITIKIPTWTGDATQSGSSFLQFILPIGQAFVFPTTRMIDSADQGIDDGTLINSGNFEAPNSLEYVDSTADTTEGFADDDDTTITFDDGSGGVAHHMFRVNDLIRLDNEICRIKSIVDTAGDGLYTPAHLLVDRAVHGSTKADHTNNTNIRFPFFNNYHEFDDTSYNGGGNGSAVLAKTNVMGKFKATNFFGYGRTSDFTGSGLLPGSVAITFYSSGYQELGISGASANSSSSLAVSTQYRFDLAVDGGTATHVNFTTDSSNVNWGGKNGIVNKINDAIRTLNDTTGSALLDRKCVVSIVNGDIRFTSGSHLSTSAIALTTSDGAGADIWEVGRVPAQVSIRAATPASLPSETTFDSYTNEEIRDNRSFMYDDGAGNLIWNGSHAGTISYDSGSVDFVGPINAEFEISASYGSGLSGRVNESYKNTIEEISARSMNTKVNGLVHMRVIG